MKKETMLIEEYRKRGAEYRIPLKEGEWERLEADLRSVRFNRSMTEPLKIWTISAFIIIALLAGINLWHTGKKVRTERLTTEKQYIIPTGRSPVIPEIPPDPIPASRTADLAVLSTRLKTFPIKTDSISPSSENSPSPACALTDTFEHASYNDKEQEKNPGKEQTGRPVQCRKANRPTPYPLPVFSPNKKQKWSVGLMAGSTLNRVKYDSQKLKIMTSGSENLTIETNKNESSPPVWPLQYSDIIYEILSESEKEIYTNILHTQPLTAGVSIARHLNDRISLESGLTYTLLSSDLKSGNTFYLIQHRRLHYLGIPLKLNYTLWDRSGFSFYLSQGAMAEFCVKGLLKTGYYKNGELRRQHTGSHRPGHPQFSLLFSPGVQYRFAFVPSLSLFAEPGVIYYFNDESKISTIRKDRPFNFNIRTGLRFAY